MFRHESGQRATSFTTSFPAIPFCKRANNNEPRCLHPYRAEALAPPRLRTCRSNKKDPGKLQCLPESQPAQCSVMPTAWKDIVRSYSCSKTMHAHATLVD